MSTKWKGQRLNVDEMDAYEMRWSTKMSVDEWVGRPDIDETKVDEMSADQMKGSPYLNLLLRIKLH